MLLLPSLAPLSLASRWLSLRRCLNFCSFPSHRPLTDLGFQGEGLAKLTRCLGAWADCRMRQWRRQRGLVSFYTMFEAIEWPDNYANRCGISVYTHINVTECIEMMATRFFMVSSMIHSIQTYLLDSHLSGTYLDTTVVYMDTSWCTRMVSKVPRRSMRNTGNSKIECLRQHNTRVKIFYSTIVQ
jgi:hypothetical protein